MNGLRAFKDLPVKPEDDDGAVSSRVILPAGWYNVVLNPSWPGIFRGAEPEWTMCEE
jgi:hypothetical protein